MFDEIEELEREIWFLNSLNNPEIDCEVRDPESDMERNGSVRLYRMKPFYETRKDIFNIFNEVKIFETFRFDREIIRYI